MREWLDVRRTSAVVPSISKELVSTRFAMRDELRTYRAYARFVKRLLLLSGIWPGEKGEPNVVYRQVSVLSIACSLVICCALGNFCRINITNLSLLTKSLGLFGSGIAVILKTFIFRAHRKDVRKASQILDGLFEDALSQPRLRTPLFSLLRFFYRPAHVLSFLTVAIVIVYMLKPFIPLLRQLGKGGAPVELKVLPYPGVYPWSIGDSVVLYQLHYFVEAQFSWFIALVTCGADTLFGFYLFQMSALLRVLAFEFEDLRSRDYPESVFRECVEKHLRLLECRDIVQKLYGPIVLLMAITNALILCSYIFQLFQPGETGISEVVLSSIYMSMKVLQTFLYAWYGQMITSESEALRREVYHSGWHETGDRDFGRAVLLVTIQRPMAVTACHFFQISLDFFVRILNTTISYFFLMQTLTDDR